MPYMPGGDEGMNMSNNPMFEIEADNLARKQAMLQEELDKEKLSGAAVSYTVRGCQEGLKWDNKRRAGRSQCLHSAGCTTVVIISCVISNKL
jgi:hypothetical protein